MLVGILVSIEGWRLLRNMFNVVEKATAYLIYIYIYTYPLLAQSLMFTAERSDLYKFWESGWWYFKAWQATW